MYKHFFLRPLENTKNENISRNIFHTLFKNIEKEIIVWYIV